MRMHARNLLETAEDLIYTCNQQLKGLLSRAPKSTKIDGCIIQLEPVKKWDVFETQCALTACKSTSCLQDGLVGLEVCQLPHTQSAVTGALLVLHAQTANGQ